MRLVQQSRAVLEHFDETRLVERRIGVGRAREAGHPTRNRRVHFGFERGLVLEARLAQPRGQVDETGRDDEALGVDDAARAPSAGRLADRGNLARRDVDRRHAVDRLRGVDDAAVLDLYFHQLPAMMLITAIRTAMPNVTCGRMTERSPSATAESISTPRFIGPGCMTITSGLATASFSGVRP